MEPSNSLDGEAMDIVPSNTTQPTDDFAGDSPTRGIVVCLEQLPRTRSRASSSYVHRHLRSIDGSKWSLPELCETISQISALERLKVIASECYISHGIVRHRYLLLELSHGQNTVWMRLDRRRSQTSIPSFVSALMKGPANDTVRCPLVHQRD